MVRAIDISGERYGKITVVEKLKEKGKHGESMYLCKCDCGNVKKYKLGDIRSGGSHIRSCGCEQYKREAKDITGEKRAKLEAKVNTGRKSSNGDYVWVFLCDCGNFVSSTIGRFRYGKIQSCGCIMKEAWKNRKNYHGLSDSVEHKAWLHMRERCYSKNDINYPNYGERGIEVCERWLGEDGFKNFYGDMGQRPEGKSLDRIDVDKNYSPDNCRWASKEMQAFNKQKKKSNTSGKTGVSRNGNRWRAVIRHGGKTKHLISTDDFELAEFCREEAELHFYGQKLGH